MPRFRPIERALDLWGRYKYNTLNHHHNFRVLVKVAGTLIETKAKLALMWLHLNPNDTKLGWDTKSCQMAMEKNQVELFGLSKV